jgi:hypothetical protein
MVEGRQPPGDPDRRSDHAACAAVEKPLRHRLLGRSRDRRRALARRVNARERRPRDGQDYGGVCVFNPIAGS